MHAENSSRQFRKVEKSSLKFYLKRDFFNHKTDSSINDLVFNHVEFPLYFTSLSTFIHRITIICFPQTTILSFFSIAPHTQLPTWSAFHSYSTCWFTLSYIICVHWPHLRYLLRLIVSIHRCCASHFISCRGLSEVIKFYSQCLQTNKLLHWSRSIIQQANC